MGSSSRPTSRLPQTSLPEHIVESTFSAAADPNLWQLTCLSLTALVAEEVDPQDPSRFQRAALIDIQIVPDAQDSTNEPQDQTLAQGIDQENLLLSQQASLKIRSPVLEKHTEPAAFILPTKNQKITTGHHLNISFFNAVSSPHNVSPSLL